MIKFSQVYEEFEKKLSPEEKDELKKILSNKLSLLLKNVKYMNDETLMMLDRYLEKIVSS